MSNTRKERLNELYECLRRKGIVHTKKDLAESIDQTLPAMYSAFSGNEDYLTDSLFRRICYVYPEFNIDYLLNGNGSLLLTKDQPEEIHRKPSDDMPDFVQSLIDKTVELATRCESLEQKLSVSIADNRDLKSKLTDALKQVERTSEQLAATLRYFSNQHSVEHLNSMVNEPINPPQQDLK